MFTNKIIYIYISEQILFIVLHLITNILYLYEICAITTKSTQNTYNYHDRIIYLVFNICFYFVKIFECCLTYD